MWSAAHVRRVEAGDHRIEARLLGRRQRLVGLRAAGVRERVVVERRIGLQVVGRREVARVAVRPRLLQRDAEQRDAPDSRPHDFQEVADAGAFLDVVGQVEVRVVQLVGGAGGALAFGGAGSQLRHCPSAAPAQSRRRGDPAAQDVSEIGLRQSETMDLT
jgi:hypothetical protein